MRLIDANVFEVVVLEDLSEYFVEGVQYALEILDKSPTIEARPVVRGEWVEKRIPLTWCEDDVDVFYVCSVCRGNNCGESPFCPNCGADMRGDGDGAD